uniref:LIM domain kinase 2 n=1 Tax=Maylandia zebra TaxID=106582 RepID=A0A3P9DE82_9CICH
NRFYLSVCSVCCDHLTNWYYEKDGKLYCRNHYWEKFGELCHGCSLLMTGPAMVAGEHKYHPECFVCLSCKVVIEDRDTYALVERSKLYCGKCYKQEVLTPMLEKRSYDSVLDPCPHGDPHLDAFCSQWEERPLCVSAEGCQWLSECSGQRVRMLISPEVRNAIHVGDRILEINGLPVATLMEQEVGLHIISDTYGVISEYDPVRHRLDRLRLESPGNRLGVPATSRMRMSSPSDTVLERTDVVDDGTLKRRSLRRSNSICKSPGPTSPKDHPFITRDIGRSESLRSSASCSHRIFRPFALRSPPPLPTPIQHTPH